ncbi:MAG: peptidoglycan DD-metalloendopeptidase family protein, partial [Muribaculaceae bacterium]|nr:peptidoglycan DD-metalloendopeptidase family protein [Muribaculaceae bacterium]
ANRAMEYLNQSLKQVEEKRNEQTQVISKLQKDGNTLKSVISSQEKKLRELDDELEKLIKQEEKRAKEAARKAAAQKANEKANAQTTESPKAESKPTAETKPAKTESPAEDIRKLSGTFEQNKGKLPMPVTGKGIIVKHFGRQRHDQLKNVETNNGGIDIETSSDSRARAIFEGKVSGVFQTSDFNNVVMVRHGEYLTIYVNIAGVNVKSGQEVKTGDIIGTIFSDPNDDNRTVLHFEIRHEVEKLNPELWLKP